MSRGRRTTNRKHDIWKEICQQLGIKFKESWLSAGSTITADAFEAALHAIARERGIPPSTLSPPEQIVWRMLHNSIEAMVSALATINDPGHIYRLESFLFEFTNSWELLLKARIVSLWGDADAMRDQDNPRRTISFQRALHEVFPSEKDAVRLNLERIEDLRNHAAHLILQVVPPNALQIFQAGILNYERHLAEWFQRSLTERIPRGMIFLVSEIDPAASSVDRALLSRRITEEAAIHLKEWQSQTRRDLEALDDEHVGQYAIALDVRVAIVANPKKADILASWSKESSADRTIAIRYQRTIDRYPHSYRNLLAKIRSARPGTGPQVVNAIIKRNRVKENEELSGHNFPNKDHEAEYIQTGRLSPATPSLYNDRALDFILRELEREPSNSRLKPTTAVG